MSPNELVRAHEVLAEVFGDERSLTHRYQLQRQSGSAQSAGELAQELMAAASGAAAQRRSAQACRWARWAAQLQSSLLVPCSLVYAETGHTDRLIELEELFADQPMTLTTRAYRALISLDQPTALAEFDYLDPTELAELSPTDLILVSLAVFHVGRVRLSQGDYGQPRAAMRDLRAEMDSKCLQLAAALEQMPEGDDATDLRFAQLQRMQAGLIQQSALLEVWQLFDGLNQTQVVQLHERLNTFLESHQHDESRQHATGVAVRLVASTSFLACDFERSRVVLATTRKFDGDDWQNTANMMCAEARMDFFAGAWDQAHLRLQSGLSRSWGDREDVASLMVRALACLVPLCRGEFQAAAEELGHVAAVARDSSAYSAASAMVAFVHAWSTIATRGPASGVVESLGPLWESALGGTYASVPTAVPLVRALVAEGEIDRARKLTASLCDIQLHPQVRSYVKEHCLGVLAMADGQAEQAQGHYRQAAELLDDLPGDPLTIYRVILTEDIAMAASELGEEGSYTEAPDNAILHLRRIRAVPWAQALEQVRAEVASPDAGQLQAEPVPTLLAELTSRERDVALRVAGGLSNREIANEDVVSVRTVEYHVSNILRKTSLASRVELRRSIQQEQSLHARG